MDTPDRNRISTTSLFEFEDSPDYFNDHTDHSFNFLTSLSSVFDSPQWDSRFIHDSNQSPHPSKFEHLLCGNENTTNKGDVLLQRTEQMRCVTPGSSAREVTAELVNDLLGLPNEFPETMKYGCGSPVSDSLSCDVLERSRGPEMTAASLTFPQPNQGDLSETHDFESRTNLRNICQIEQSDEPEGCEWVSVVSSFPDTEKHLLPRKRGSCCLSSTLPGFGLHLNALATASKKRKVVRCEALVKKGEEEYPGCQTIPSSDISRGKRSTSSDSLLDVVGSSHKKLCTSLKLGTSKFFQQSKFETRLQVIPEDGTPKNSESNRSQTSEDSPDYFNDHSFNFLSFTSPTSSSSVFYSQQWESSFILDSNQSPHPLKFEHLLCGNENTTSKGDVLLQRTEQLGCVTPGSSAREVTAEPVNEPLGLANELPESMKYGYGSPVSDRLSCDVIERSRGPEMTDASSSFTQPNQGDSRETHDFESRTNLRNICRIEQSDELEGCEWVSVVSSFPDILSSTLHNKLVASESKEKVDDKEEEYGQSSCKDSPDYFNDHTDHSFNFLSFTSPTSPSSVFDSQQWESRFILDSNQSPHPLKFEYLLCGNENTTSKGDVLLQRTEQLGCVTPGSSAREVTAEPVNEPLGLANELPESMKYGYGSPVSDRLSCDVIERSRGPEMTDASSSFTQPNQGDSRETHDFESRTNLRNICRIEQSDELEGCEWVSVVSSFPDILSSTLHNKLVASESKEKVDDKEEEYGQSSCKDSPDYFNDHTDHSFNFLSFTSPTSPSSVFDSQQWESRFILDSNQSPHPLKFEHLLCGNENTTSKGDVLLQRTEQLGCVTPGSSAREVIAEPVNEPLGLANELPESMKYGCGRPVSDRLSCDVIERSSGLEMTAASSSFEQTDEAEGCDWVSLVSSSPDLLTYDSPLVDNEPEEQDQKTVDPWTTSFVNSFLQLPQDNTNNLESMVSASGSSKHCELTQSGEIGDLKDQAPDILFSTLLNTLIASESKEKVDDKEEEHIQSSCKLQSESSHIKVGNKEKYLLPSKRGSCCLSSTFTTLASGRHSISMRSSASSSTYLTSGQNLLNNSSTRESVERDSVLCDNKAQDIGAEEFDNYSPKRKRFKQEPAGESIACKHCNCKMSKCLKLYCECFAAGRYCVEPCSCLDCFNKPTYEDTVMGTRKQIKSRNPLAFAPKLIRSTNSALEFKDETKTSASARHKRGCNCKKSNCLKRYCECFKGGVGCSIYCRCEGCKNAFGRKDVGDEQTENEKEESEACERNGTDRNSNDNVVKKGEEEYPGHQTIHSSDISRASSDSLPLRVYSYHLPFG